MLGQRFYGVLGRLSKSQRLLDLVTR